MPVTEINHVNLRTPYETMLKLKDFYCDVVGLKVGPREGFTSRGFWLYIGDNDVLHLAEYRGDGEPLTNVLTTLDHVSFTCTDMPAMEAHLKAHNISYTIRDLPVLNVKQINFKDPVGNGIELFFIWIKSNVMRVTYNWLNKTKIAISNQRLGVVIVLSRALMF